jgi:tight adherence protein B
LKRLSKGILIYTTIIAVLFVLSIPFISDPALRLFTVSFLAFLPFAASRSDAKTKEVQIAREQLKSLLEQLCIKVSTGKSLETAFSESREELSAIYGGRSSLCLALKVFEDKTSSGAALDESILCLVERIPCPEAAPLFHAIAGSRMLGNRILQILRQSLLMVSDLLSITRDISSDVSQKRLESTIMSMMPIAVIWSLHLTVPSYLEPAFSNPWGELLMLFAFILTVAGYCLGCIVVSRSIYSKIKASRISRPSSLSALVALIFARLVRPYPRRIAPLRRIVLLLPEGYRLHLQRTLRFLAPYKDFLLEEYLYIKIALLLACFGVYFIFSFFMPVPFLLFLAVAFLLMFLHDMDTNSLILRNKMQMMQDFPTFVGLLSTLLGNGIVLSKSLMLCIETFRDSSPAFRNELNMLRGIMAAGTPGHEALENLANRCQIPEIACALQFAAQFDKTGSVENLNLLKLQCSACWTQGKITARKQLDESSVKLLVPMLLQLVCVMMITITPSLISIQQIV